MKLFGHILQRSVERAYISPIKVQFFVCLPMGGSSMIGIYKITNLINGNSYIGQSINIKLRWNKHRSVAFQPNSESYYYPLYRAIRKYGLDNFEFSILEECSEELLNVRELFWGNYYDVYQNGYNQTSGINANGGHGMLLTIQKVEEIQNLLLNTSISQLDLADKYGVSKDTICSINVGRSWVNELLTYPIRTQYPTRTIVGVKMQYFCMDCGKEICSMAKRCVECHNLSKRKVERPSREELKQLIRTMPFTKIAKQYGVSDKAICKWCDAENLPRRKKEINQYTDNEWEQI